MVNELPGDKIATPLVVPKSVLLPTSSQSTDLPFVQPDRPGETLDANKTFTPSDTVQPAATESHSLSAGVILKEGTATKSGPQPKRNELRMTRKEYTSLVEGESSIPGMSLRKVCLFTCMCVCQRACA